MLFVYFSIFQFTHENEIYLRVKYGATFVFHCIENHIPQHQKNNSGKGFLDHFLQSRFTEWHTHTWSLSAKKITLPDSVFLHPIHPGIGNLLPT